MQENSKLEFKETISNTFLKTVSAFANYEGGSILFGITDDGKEVGITNSQEACIAIEHKINDSISPQIDFLIDIIKPDNIIELKIIPGENKPYLYKSKAYKRNDTSTIEVDSLEFTRLVLEGKNLNFEDLPAQNQKLSFNTLSSKLTEHMNLQKFDLDTLKTLNLYSHKHGYTNAAALLADTNSFPGIDIAVFGENINIIKKRITFEHISVLSAYHQTIKIYQDFFQYEQIKGAVRTKVELLPENAFREAIANALIHRTWDINSHIRVLMFEDKIEVYSPGGLPVGISKEEYVSGKLSRLRNPNLANVFFRLHLVEIFGTGILRILNEYAMSSSKPSFEISHNAIQISLPLFKNKPRLSKDEDLVYATLSKTIPKAITQIIEGIPFGKSKTTNILQRLSKQGYIEIIGTGRGTKYKLTN